MRIRALLIIIALLTALQACRFPAATGGIPLAAPPGGDTTSGGATPTVTATPTITPTGTPSNPMVTPKDQPVNCRFGPALEFSIISALLVGNSVPILGKSADGYWWQIQNPAGGTVKCWVAANVTVASGNLSSVPVVAAPLAFVTSVAAVNPDIISVVGCMGPIPVMPMTGAIKVNGPVDVTWHFETQQSGALSTYTTGFTSSGSQSVADSSYAPPLPPGTYWLRLVVTSPNNMVGEGSYTIVCP